MPGLSMRESDEINHRDVFKPGTEILKSYYNDGNVKPPLYYYRDKDQNDKRPKLVND